MPAPPGRREAPPLRLLHAHPAQATQEAARCPPCASRMPAPCVELQHHRRRRPLASARRSDQVLACIDVELGVVRIVRAWQPLLTGRRDQLLALPQRGPPRASTSRRGDLVSLSLATVPKGWGLVSPAAGALTAGTLRSSRARAAGTRGAPGFVLRGLAHLKLAGARRRTLAPKLSAQTREPGGRRRGGGGGGFIDKQRRRRRRRRRKVYSELTQ